MGEHHKRGTRQKLAFSIAIVGIFGKLPFTISSRQSCSHASFISRKPSAVDCRWFSSRLASVAGRLVRPVNYGWDNGWLISRTRLSLPCHFSKAPQTTICMCIKEIFPKRISFLCSLVCISLLYPWTVIVFLWLSHTLLIIYLQLVFSRLLGFFCIYFKKIARLFQHLPTQSPSRSPCFTKA